MEIWHIWILVALGFVILEIFTTGFAVACFSIGALGAVLASVFGASLLWQFLVFAALSLLALIFVRPMVMKLFYKEKNEQTNADAIIGRKARVSETIDPATGKGRVALDGDDWKAESIDGTVLSKGEQVEIIERKSIIVKVKKI